MQKELNPLHEPRQFNGSHIAAGNNLNPKGERQIAIDKKRKFATKPKEYAKLLHEVMSNELDKRDFDRHQKRLILKITEQRITDKTYEAYINMTADEIYSSIEIYILSKI